MELILLGPGDLALAACLILALALLSWRLHLGIEKRLLINASRTVVQLTLLGLILKWLFERADLLTIGALSLFMLAMAGWEVRARQQRRFTGYWGYGIGVTSMLLSSFTITLITLLILVRPDPWYAPQYAITLLGMLLGNTMSGVAIALDNLTQNTERQQGTIEARLLLGDDWQTAIGDIRRQALRSGLIPIINAMAAAGIITLPGMMTGQILAGGPPLEAAKYQILIMLLIGAGTGFGATAAVWIASKRLFDDRQRLRLDRLAEKK
jgi:putative ABC transport system permease protein